MHEINLDGGKQNICYKHVGDIWIGGKPDKLKKVGPRTVYRTDKSEEEEGKF